MNKFIIQLLENLLDYLNLAPCTEIALNYQNFSATYQQI
jgi:hypothetical protein